MCDDSFLSDYDEYDIPASSYSSELNVGYHCFEEMCVCSNTSADCSRNGKNLTFVPRLPDITFLDFSYNMIHHIPEDFFLNVTNITGLDLSHNGIAGIDSGAFRPLEKLQTLILSYNHKLTYNIMLPVFLLPGLKRLELVHIKLGYFPPKLFQLLPMANLELLNLQDNDISATLPDETFDLAVFSPLKKLRVLSLSGSHFMFVVSAHLSSLEDLDLSNGHVSTFPSTCDGERSLFPSLQKLNLVGGLGTIAIPTHVCLPKLQILRVTLNAVSPHTFTNTRFPDLRELYIQDFNSGLSEHAFMSTTLQLLSIGCVLDFFNDDTINNESLEGCTNLTTLVFSHCHFSSVSSSKLHRIFSSLPSLKHLGLASTSISTITDIIFPPLPSLTSLDLQGNFIKEIPDGVFDALPNLRSLDLSNNLISTVRAFSSRTRQTLIYLDLSENPFKCSCDVMWIKNWQASDPAIFSNTWLQYTCRLNYRSTLINMSSFYLNEWTCAFSDGVYLAIIIVSIIVIICIVITSVCIYPVCVSFKPVVYLKILEIQGNARKEINKCRDDYKYDVFIAYASEDITWIREHLMPQLEGERGLKLCVSERDFTPGKEIVANITDSLEVSRQVMVVFSTDFARSPWCQYELTLCLTHALENAYDLLVVYLQDIPPWEMTKKMSAVLKTCTYLQWSDNHEMQRLFWFKLKEALFDVTQAAARAASQNVNYGTVRGDMFQLTEVVAPDFNREVDTDTVGAFNTDAEGVAENTANDVMHNLQDDLKQFSENGVMDGNGVVGAATNDVMRSTVCVLIHNDRPQHL